MIFFWFHNIGIYGNTVRPQLEFECLRVTYQEKFRRKETLLILSQFLLLSTDFKYQKITVSKQCRHFLKTSNVNLAIKSREII